MSDPGPVPLRPLGFADILDGSFALYRSGLRVVVPLVLAVMVPLQLLAAFLQRDALRLGIAGVLNDAATADLLRGSGGLGAGLVTSLVVQLLVAPVLAGALVAAAQAIRAGQQTSVREVAGAALRLSGWLVGVYVLGVLVRSVLLLVAAGAAASGADVLVGLALVLGIPALLLLTPLLVLVTPAIMAQDRPPVQAVVHAVTLVRGSYLRTVGIVLGTTVVLNLVAGLLAGIPSVLGLLSGLGFGWVLVGIGNVVTQLVVAPLNAAAMVLLHTDLRVRQEGLDLDVALAALRGPST